MGKLFGDLQKLREKANRLANDAKHEQRPQEVEAATRRLDAGRRTLTALLEGGPAVQEVAARARLHGDVAVGKMTETLVHLAPTLEGQRGEIVAVVSQIDTATAALANGGTIAGAAAPVERAMTRLFDRAGVPADVMPRDLLEDLAEDASSTPAATQRDAQQRRGARGGDNATKPEPRRASFLSKFKLPAQAARTIDALAGGGLPATSARPGTLVTPIQAINQQLDRSVPSSPANLEVSPSGIVLSGNLGSLTGLTGRVELGKDGVTATGSANLELGGVTLGGEVSRGADGTTVSGTASGTIAGVDLEGSIERDADGAVTTTASASKTLGGVTLGGEVSRSPDGTTVSGTASGTIADVDLEGTIERAADGAVTTSAKASAQLGPLSIEGTIERAADGVVTTSASLDESRGLGGLLGIARALGRKDAVNTDGAPVAAAPVLAAGASGTKGPAQTGERGAGASATAAAGKPPKPHAPAQLRPALGADGPALVGDRAGKAMLRSLAVAGTSMTVGRYGGGALDRFLSLDLDGPGLELGTPSRSVSEQIASTSVQVPRSKAAPPRLPASTRRFAAKRTTFDTGLGSRTATERGRSNVRGSVDAGKRRHREIQGASKRTIASTLQRHETMRQRVSSNANAASASKRTTARTPSRGTPNPRETPASVTPAETRAQVAANQIQVARGNDPTRPVAVPTTSVAGAPIAPAPHRRADRTPITAAHHSNAQPRTAPNAPLRTAPDAPLSATEQALQDEARTAEDAQRKVVDDIGAATHVTPASVEPAKDRLRAQGLAAKQRGAGHARAATAAHKARHRNAQNKAGHAKTAAAAKQRAELAKQAKHYAEVKDNFRRAADQKLALALDLLKNDRVSFEADYQRQVDTQVTSLQAKLKLAYSDVDKHWKVQQVELGRRNVDAKAAVQTYCNQADHQAVVDNAAICKLLKKDPQAAMKLAASLLAKDVKRLSTQCTTTCNKMATDAESDKKKAYDDAQRIYDNAVATAPGEDTPENASKRASILGSALARKNERIQAANKKYAGDCEAIRAKGEEFAKLIKERGDAGVKTIENIRDHGAEYLANMKIDLANQRALIEKLRNDTVTELDKRRTDDEAFIKNEIEAEKRDLDAQLEDERRRLLETKQKALENWEATQAKLADADRNALIQAAQREHDNFVAQLDKAKGADVLLLRSELQAANSNIDVQLGQMGNAMTAAVNKVASWELEFSDRIEQRTQRLIGKMDQAVASQTNLANSVKSAADALHRDRFEQQLSTPEQLEAKQQATERKKAAENEVSQLKQDLEAMKAGGGTDKLIAIFQQKLEAKEAEVQRQAQLEQGSVSFKWTNALTEYTQDVTARTTELVERSSYDAQRTERARTYKSERNPSGARTLDEVEKQTALTKISETQSGRASTSVDAIQLEILKQKLSPDEIKQLLTTENFAHLSLAAQEAVRRMAYAKDDAAMRADILDNSTSGWRISANKELFAEAMNGLDEFDRASVGRNFQARTGQTLDQRIDSAASWSKQNNDYLKAYTRGPEAVLSMKLDQARHGGWLADIVDAGNALPTWARVTLGVVTLGESEAVIRGADHARDGFSTGTDAAIDVLSNARDEVIGPPPPNDAPAWEQAAYDAKVKRFMTEADAQHRAMYGTSLEDALVARSFGANGSMADPLIGDNQRNAMLSALRGDWDKFSSYKVRAGGETTLGNRAWIEQERQYRQGRGEMDKFLGDFGGREGFEKWIDDNIPQATDRTHFKLWAQPELKPGDPGFAAQKIARAADMLVYSQFGGRTGLGDDHAAINQTLAGLSADELAQVRSQYAAQIKANGLQYPLPSFWLNVTDPFGMVNASTGDLDADLYRSFGGVWSTVTLGCVGDGEDYHVAKYYLQHGKPTTAAEGQRFASYMNDFRNQGMTSLARWQGKVADREWAKQVAAYEQLEALGLENVPLDDPRVLARMTSEQRAAVASYQVRDQVAKAWQSAANTQQRAIADNVVTAVTTTATVLGAIVGGVVTGGAATVLIAAGAALVTGAAAMTAKMAMLGGKYGGNEFGDDLKNMAIDAIVDALTAGVGAGMKALENAGKELSEKIAAGVIKREALPAADRALLRAFEKLEGRKGVEMFVEELIDLSGDAAKELTDAKNHQQGGFGTALQNVAGNAGTRQFQKATKGKLGKGKAGKSFDRLVELGFGVDPTRPLDEQLVLIGTKLTTRGAMVIAPRLGDQLRMRMARRGHVVYLPKEQYEQVKTRLQQEAATSGRKLDTYGTGSGAQEIRVDRGKGRIVTLTTNANDPAIVTAKQERKRAPRANQPALGSPKRPISVSAAEFEQVQERFVQRAKTTGSAVVRSTDADGYRQFTITRPDGSRRTITERPRERTGFSTYAGKEATVAGWMRIKRSYYQVIDGKRYDRALLEIAAESTTATKPGTRRSPISKAEAQRLAAKVRDGGRITEVERATVEHLLASYKWTPAARTWFVSELGLTSGLEHKLNVPALRALEQSGGNETLKQALLTTHDSVLTKTPAQIAADPKRLDAHIKSLAAIARQELASMTKEGTVKVLPHADIKNRLKGVTWDGKPIDLQTLGGYVSVAENSANRSSRDAIAQKGLDYEARKETPFLRDNQVTGNKETKRSVFVIENPKAQAAKIPLEDTLYRAIVKRAADGDADAKYLVPYLTRSGGDYTPDNPNNPHTGTGFGNTGGFLQHREINPPLTMEWKADGNENLADGATLRFLDHKGRSKLVATYRIEDGKGRWVLDPNLAPKQRRAYERIQTR